MVFLSFPAADIAADAVETLKMSTVDGKELYTKVLPNIHVSISGRTTTGCKQLGWRAVNCMNGTNV